MQTLTWQGAHVVASLGIDGPRTKSDADGVITDAQTITDLEEFARLAMPAATHDAHWRLDRVRVVVADAGVDPAHIAPAD